MQREDMLSINVPRLTPLLDRLPDDQATRFPNLELIETQTETVYFDARREGHFWWASPLQTYLELMSGDKRDQETAEQIKSRILNPLLSARQ
jgi:hypothetical protein